MGNLVSGQRANGPTGKPSSPLQRWITTVAVLGVMLVGLPLMGVWGAGFPVTRYLEFPPATRYVAHAPFSWIAFGAYAAFIAGAVAPFVSRGFGRRGAAEPRQRPARPFPWWGWAAAGMTALFWVLAWTRFSWFAAFQPHTFTPLWIGYAVTVNALTYRRTGRCMMVRRPGLFLVLFPVSAAFWWFFEFLNRFVQNWYYSGVRYGPATYFVLATMAFSTVLPAVSATREWLATHQRLCLPFVRFHPVAISHPKRAAGLALLVAGAGLAGIGVLPDLLFPLLWVSPLLIVVSIQTLFGEVHLLQRISRGDWSGVVTAALSALVCGFFWEMWNHGSLARWAYAVPWVHRFPIFEMPVLGYAGYLPFGLECAMVVDWVARAVGRGRRM